MISIIIPVYNVDKYLRQCLDSIVAQTCHDFEAILIDDGSTDLSGDICDEYAKAYNCIEVIHQKNGGVSLARNKGLEVAKGDYVTFVDADDMITPDYVEVLIQRGCLVDVAFFSIEFMGSQMKEQDYRIIPDFCSNDRNIVENYLLDYIKPTIFGYTWSKMFRLALIRENKIRFEEGLNFKEDYLFTTQYLHYAVNVCGIKDVLYIYRTNSNDSLSKKASLEPASVLFKYVKLIKKQIVNYNHPNLVTYEYRRIAETLHLALYRKGNLFVFSNIVVELRGIMKKEGVAQLAVIPDKLRFLLSLPTIVNVPLIYLYIVACKLKISMKDKLMNCSADKSLSSESKIFII